MNPLHTLRSSFFIIHSNTVLPPTQRSSQLSLSFRFSYKKFCTHFSPFLPVWHARPIPFVSTQIFREGHRFWKSSCCNSLHPPCKVQIFSYQGPVLKSAQSVLLPQHKKLNFTLMQYLCNHNFRIYFMKSTRSVRWVFNVEFRLHGVTDARSSHTTDPDVSLLDTLESPVAKLNCEAQQQKRSMSRWQSWHLT
jgi:hypothetical protein